MQDSDSSSSTGRVGNGIKIVDITLKREKKPPGRPRKYGPKLNNENRKHRQINNKYVTIDKDTTTLTPLEGYQNVYILNDELYRYVTKYNAYRMINALTRKGKRTYRIKGGDDKYHYIYPFETMKNNSHHLDENDGLTNEQELTSE